MSILRLNSLISYVARVVVPKEASNAKDPNDGFVIQESSTTGVRASTDFSIRSIDSSDVFFERNPRFISTCSDIRKHSYNYNYKKNYAHLKLRVFRMNASLTKKKFPGPKIREIRNPEMRTIRNPEKPKPVTPKNRITRVGRNLCT